MPFEDLAMLFRSANLVVYPSYYEGQGLIPLEAMSSGTPVVTVNHGPLPEMVDNTVGSLFKMGDVDSMAESILLELSNPDAPLLKAWYIRMASFAIFDSFESEDLGLLLSLNLSG